MPHFHPLPDPFAAVQVATRQHRAQHGCGAYTFEDGPGLAVLSALRRPRRILELGTALGYTACCLAHGSSQAEVDTVEGDADHVALARDAIQKHGLAARIRVHHGPFETVMPRLQPGYDMAFFDGFAPDLHLLRQLRDLLAADGVLVCANLGLADRQASEGLMTELTQPRRWLSGWLAESGRTLVAVKQEIT